MKTKRILCIFIFAVLIFSMVACSDTGQNEAGYYYEPEKYRVVGDSCGGNRIIPSSFEELEVKTRFLQNGDQNQYGAIVLCSVSGRSINRIIEPTEDERDPARVYGINHVLTPVKIDKIIYAGEKTGIKEGETYLVKEPFFYIVESAEPYFSMYGGGSVYAEEYNPLQKEYHYIIYVNLLDNEIYNYGGTPVLSMNGLQEAVYCLDIEDAAKKLVNTSSDNYWVIWEKVVENYYSERLK